jgi:L-iditol 2-dehydrogenase
MLACGICGSDLMTWYQDPRAPVVLGHEPVAVVERPGAGSALVAGQRVFVHHHVPCMDCPRCRAGRHTLCDRFRATAIRPGGLAERAAVPLEHARLDVLPLPDGLSDRAGTLVEPLACVVRGQRMAGVSAGSRVAVVGAGSMGLLEIDAARAAGAAAVVAVEPRADRRSLAEAAGAIARAEPEPAAVRAALGGALADAVIVCTAARAAIAGALHLAAPGGVVQLFAPTPPGEMVPLDLGAVWFREVTIQSTYSAGPEDTRAALDLLAAGAIGIDRVVSHVVPLAEIERAFELARSGAATKVVVEIAAAAG